jgi:hypothetical protein
VSYPSLPIAHEGWSSVHGIWGMGSGSSWHCLLLATMLRTPMNTRVLGQYILYEDVVSSSRVHSLGDVGSEQWVVVAERTRLSVVVHALDITQHAF